MNGVPDQFADLLFPMQGLDISVEFELQPPGTTDSGTNVRAYEPLAGRQRGGSRPGMVKYVDGLTAAGASVIQLLDTIVDPTVDALLASFDDPGFNGDTVILDPSTNNFAPADDPYGGGASETGNPVGDGFTLARNPKRRIREGGSGIPPNRHRAGTGTVPPPPPPGNVAFVQAKSAHYDNTGNSQSIAFDANATSGNLIVVVVALSSTLAGWTPSVTVSDNQSTTYGQAGTFTAQAFPFSDGGVACGIFFGIWNHTSGPCTVTVDPTDAPPSNMAVAILEYSNISTPPLGGSDGGQGTLLADPAIMSAGTPTAFAGGLLVAAFASAFEDDTFTATTGFAPRVNIDTAEAQNLFVVDVVGVAATVEATAGVNGVNAYAARSATFKKA